MAQAFDRYAADDEAGVEYVCHRNGRRILNYRKGWETAVRAAGLPHFPMYDIRHVSASEMLADGADLAAVSAQLEHSNPHTTGILRARHGGEPATRGGAFASDGRAGTVRGTGTVQVQ
jgi:integrase